VEELHERLGLPVEIGAPPCSAGGGNDAQEMAVLCGLAVRANGLLPGINFIVPSS